MRQNIIYMSTILANFSLFCPIVAHALVLLLDNQPVCLYCMHVMFSCWEVHRFILGEGVMFLKTLWPNIQHYPTYKTNLLELGIA